MTNEILQLAIREGGSHGRTWRIYQACLPMVALDLTQRAEAVMDIIRLPQGYWRQGYEP